MSNPQPQAVKKTNKQLPMTKKEAVDILLQNVAESKKQIELGYFHTHDQVWAHIEKRKTKPVV